MNTPAIRLNTIHDVHQPYGRFACFESRAGMRAGPPNFGRIRGGRELELTFKALEMNKLGGRN